MSEVWKHSRAEGSQLLLLLAIADHADDDGVAFPKVNNLAKKCRQQKRNIQYLLTSLEEIGELEIKRGQGRGNRSKYLVKVGEKVQTLHLLDGGEKVQGHAQKGARPCAEKVQNGALSNPRPININHHGIITNHHVSLSSAEAAESEREKQGSVKGKKGSKQSPLVPLPDDFSVTSAMEQWAEAHTPLVPIQSATNDFIDWATTTAAPGRDWLASWRRFMRKRQEFAEQRATNRAEVKNAKGSNDAEKRARKQRERDDLAKLGY